MDYLNYSVRPTLKPTAVRSGENYASRSGLLDILWGRETRKLLA